MAVAFTNILYGATIYKPYIPQLSRLMIGSNAIQQLMVTPLSSLHFTVGQVQDIGLIFLNAMTKDIASRLDGEPIEKILGTAIMASCMTTIALGITLLGVGKCVCPAPWQFVLHSEQRNPRMDDAHGVAFLFE